MFLGLFDRTADDLRLRDFPADRETLEPLRSSFIQSECGSMSHCRHTIIHTITYSIVNSSSWREDVHILEIGDRFCLYSLFIIWYYGGEIRRYDFYGERKNSTPRQKLAPVRWYFLHHPAPRSFLESVCR